MFYRLNEGTTVARRLTKWKSCSKARSIGGSVEKFKECIKSADWHVINDVKQTFDSANVIENDWIVFSIGGSKSFNLFVLVWAWNGALACQMCRNTCGVLKNAPPELTIQN